MLNLMMVRRLKLKIGAINGVTDSSQARSSMLLHLLRAVNFLNDKITQIKKQFE